MILEHNGTVLGHLTWGAEGSPRQGEFIVHDGTRYRITAIEHRIKNEACGDFVRDVVAVLSEDDSPTSNFKATGHKTRTQ